MLFTSSLLLDIHSAYSTNPFSLFNPSFFKTYLTMELFIFQAKTDFTVVQSYSVNTVNRCLLEYTLETLHCC